MPWIRYDAYRLVPPAPLSRDSYHQIKAMEDDVFFSGVDSEINQERLDFFRRYKLPHLLSKVVLILGACVALTPLAFEKLQFQSRAVESISEFTTFYIVVPGVILLLFSGYVHAFFSHQRYRYNKRWYYEKLKEAADSSENYEEFECNKWPALMSEIDELRQ